MNINIEQKYAIIIRDLMKYIEEIKEQDNSAPLIDIIMDFTLKHDISVEAVGDAIANDEYFKSFVEKDQIYHDPKNKREVW